MDRLQKTVPQNAAFVTLFSYAVKPDYSQGKTNDSHEYNDSQSPHVTRPLRWYSSQWMV